MANEQLLDYEYQVIGAILNDESQPEDERVGVWEVVESNLSPQSFSSEECRLIFRAMIELKKDRKIADLVTLWNEKFKDSGGR